VPNLKGYTNDSRFDRQRAQREYKMAYPKPSQGKDSTSPWNFPRVRKAVDELAATPIPVKVPVIPKRIRALEVFNTVDESLPPEWDDLAQEDQSAVIKVLLAECTDFHTAIQDLQGRGWQVRGTYEFDHPREWMQWVVDETKRLRTPDVATVPYNTGGTYIRMVADDTITGGDLVYISTTGRAITSYQQKDHRPIGVAQNYAVAGQTVTVRTM
jgi:hypothetical protein